MPLLSQHVADSAAPEPMQRKPQAVAAERWETGGAPDAGSGVGEHEQPLQQTLW